jgi:hypothetical protein
MMTAHTSDVFIRWARGAGMVAIATLAWSAFVPEGLFWTAVLATGLVGAAVATMLVMRNRSVPSLAQVIESTERESAVAAARAGGARLRPRGRP